MMVRCWQRYVAFWSERERPDAYALVRITFGIALVLNLLEQLLSGDILEFYALPSEGGIFPFQRPGSPLSLFRLFAPTALHVRVLVYAHLAAAVLFTLGCATRLVALVNFFCQVTLSERMPLFAFGGDNVFRVYCFLMVLAPCGAAWSLDAWFRRRWQGKVTRSVPSWPRRLMMLQLALIYTSTGLMKCGSSWSFMDGWSALYLAVNLPGLARWPGDWAAWVYPLTQGGTFVAKWWEITFVLVPFNVFLRRRDDPARPIGWVRRWFTRWDLRGPYLLLGLVFHLSLIVLFDLGLFSPVMLSIYPSYFHPEEAQRWLEQGCRLLRIPSPPPSPPLPAHTS